MRCVLINDCLVRASLVVASSLLSLSPLEASAQTAEAYRFYTQNASGSYSDHWSTLNYNEGVNAHATYDGRSFKVLTSPIPGDNHPLYRCRNGGDHYARMSCGSSVNEGLYGYVSSVPLTGYIPLYSFFRQYGNFGQDIIETTDFNEVQIWGYYLETLGYVPQ